MTDRPTTEAGYVGWYGAARRQDWRTPQALFDRLNAAYQFDLDGELAVNPDYLRHLGYAFDGRRWTR